MDQAPAPTAPKKDAPLTAGWNGEHFFINSPDGQFSINPYGYVDTDYRAYKGDGAPADTFILRRARFGFQGSLVPTSISRCSPMLRDNRFNRPRCLPQARMRPSFSSRPASSRLHLRRSQAPAPPTWTSSNGISVDLVSLGSFGVPQPRRRHSRRYRRRRGAVLGGRVQRQGICQVNTTNQPEVIGRLASTRGANPRVVAEGTCLRRSCRSGALPRLSGDQSFNGTVPVGVYDFFPQFAINGPIQRYNGEFTTSSRHSLCAANSINSICLATMSAPNRREAWAS